MKLSFKYFFILFLCIRVLSNANEIIKELSYPELGVTELQLSNGMRVCFKPTNFDSDEILIRLSSPGGFSLFKESERASAELASKVVLESGFGNLTSDNLSTLFYNKGIDFSMETRAFSHIIDGTCPKEEVEDFFILINDAFTKANFTKTAYEDVLKREQSAINRRKLDFDSTFEEAFLALNTQNLPALRSISLEDLKKVDFDKAKEFYEKIFINPSSYICVIVGNLQVEEVKKYVIKYLVPIKEISSSYYLGRFSVEFPSGVTKKHIVTQKKGEGITRLTFPLVRALTEENITALELACQVIEARLREIIFEKFQTTQGIDVAYEMPLFPSLELAWITIQYRGNAQMVSPIAKMILGELNQLQKEGLNKEEFDAALLQQSQSDNYWLRDNDYWLSTLTNYYMLNWNPKFILKNPSTAQLTFDQVKEVIKNFFSVSNYTMISSQPTQ